jgi:alkylation response protein AidB-like acyl-CoA dehydrogenase
MAHVSWALGVGKRALDEIHALAQRKKRFGRITLIDQPVFQLEYGRNLAAMQAAKALVYQVFDDWFEAAKAGKPSLEVRARARLTACWATEVALKAAQFAMFSAGSDGVRNADGTNRLQRAFRDLQVGATHRHIDGNIFIEASQAALGVADPNLEM